MNTTKLTITHALKTIKEIEKNQSFLLDDIEKTKFSWVDSSKSITSDLTKATQSIMDKLDSYNYNYNAIKSKIAISNSTTFVDVAGTNMSVHQAIIIRDRSESLLYSYNLIKRCISTSIDKVLKDLNEIQITNMKNEDKIEQTKTKTPISIDSINKKIDSLQEFLLNCDSALDVSNATTFIEVTLR